MDISNRTIGSFFQTQDLNSTLLYAACVGIGSYLALRYPTVEAMNEIDEKTFEALGHAILPAVASTVKIWNNDYVSQSQGIKGGPQNFSSSRRTG